MGRVRGRYWPVRLASLPVLVLTAAWVVALGATVAGTNPMWRVEPLNLSEAAALRDGGEVARLMALGAAPGAAYRIRAGFLFSRPVMMTPLDAAIAAGRPEIVQLLLDSGLSLDRMAWTRAWCAAGDDSRRVLDAARQGGHPPKCHTN